jgi:hypothetical protein
MVVFRTRCLCLAQLNRGAGHTICSSEHHFKQVQPHWFSQTEDRKFDSYWDHQ